ncbi:hypothetical protein ACLFMI_12680 [Pseudonocardia nantongensis]|uniref:hypothetical protein n=1 Tax=Pseudonocardia nantongensis TaxID=1181885 RepID=UPI003978CF20
MTIDQMRAELDELITRGSKIQARELLSRVKEGEREEIANELGGGSKGEDEKQSSLSEQDEQKIQDIVKELLKPL